MSASLSNEQIEDKFFLLGQREILGILNDLAHRREPVTVYFNEGREFIVTLILSARDDGLVFDIGGDARANNCWRKPVPACSRLCLMAYGCNSAGLIRSASPGAIRMPFGCRFHRGLFECSAANISAINYPSSIHSRSGYITTRLKPWLIGPSMIYVWAA